MYRFNPMTEEELNRPPSLLEEGIYDFQVITSTRKTSRANNPMAELNIKIWDKNGIQHMLYDYLVFSEVPLNIKKIKHFCDATGFSDNYSKGQMPETLSNLSGKVQIGIQDEKPKDGGGFYPKKNYVIDYIKSDPTKQFEDIPF